MQPIAIDTETTLATNSQPVPQLVSLAICSAQGVDLRAAHDPWVPGFVQQAFEGGAIIHNAPFDVFVLLRAFPALWPAVVDAYLSDRVFDTMTREKMIDIAEGQHMRRGRYDLGAVAKRRAGLYVDKTDPWRKRYRELLGLEIERWPADAIDYAKRDAHAHYSVWYHQEVHQANCGRRLFANAGQKARKHLALYAQTLRGLLTDQRAVDELDARLLAELRRYEIELAVYGLGRVEKGKFTLSMTVAQEMMAQIPGHTISEKSGKPSLSDTALEKAKIPEGHPLDSFRRCKALRSQRSKNVTVLRWPVIRTRYDECKDTGRSGSSKPNEEHPSKLGPEDWVGTNVQNLPREPGWRECIVPPPGHVFVITDVSGAELAAFAQREIELFGDSEIGKAINAGRDVHSDTGAALLSIPYEQFDRHGNPEHKKKRQFSKPINFGYLGGMGARKMVAYAASDAYRVTMTEREAQSAKRVWLKKWNTKRYFDLISSLQGWDGYITITDPLSGFVRGGMGFSQACNHNFQHRAACGMDDTLWALFMAGNDPSSPMHGCYQVLFAHDENVTVAPIDRAEKVKQEQERIMIREFGKWVPDIRVSVESQIVERYTK